MREILQLIVDYMRRSYKPPENPSELQEESEQMQDKLRKESAGRVCWQSREDWESAQEGIKKYYEEKKLFNRIVEPAFRPPFRPR